LARLSEQKGLNFKLKVVSAPEAVEGSDGIKEVTCGDETGSIVLSIRDDAHAATCKVGACLRVQNAHVKMIKGFIRLVVDKWAVLKPIDSVEFDAVDEKNNVSKTEFELA